MALFRSTTDRIPRAGDLLADKYRVEAVIGHGGMGVVVAAVHRELAQRVAIKVMFSSARHSKDAVARFLREARTASMLRSDHSVRIHDVGRLKRGEPFIVMEYLAGTNLAQVLASRGPLPITEVVDYTLQASEAIVEAHRLGIVHRDLKPSNLFLTARSDGTPHVKVLDFGISKAEWIAGEGSGLDLTSTLEVMGTPMYMSPEQVRASRAADPRMDIWALGVVLYELIAGRPPFVADTLPAISALIVSDPAPPLHLHRPEVPAALAAVVMSCLSKDPGGRPQTAFDLAHEIAPFASAAGRESIRQIEGIVQLPADALQSQPLALPADPGLDPWPGDTGQAWGTTRARLSRGTRVGLLGAGTGIAAGLIAVVLWFAFVRTQPAPHPSPVASPAFVAVSLAEPGSSTLESAVPAPTASASASAADALPGAASTSAPSSTTTPKRGGRGRDPLDERY